MKCPHCNNELNELPLCYGIEAPYYFYTVPEEKRTELIRDFCVIDEQHFFIRGHIEIPIIDNKEKFIWSVWVTLSEENFLKSNELLHVEGREHEKPYFGWLSTELSFNISINYIIAKDNGTYARSWCCSVNRIRTNESSTCG